MAVEDRSSSLLSEDSTFVRELESNLKQANIRTPPQQYLKSAIALGSMLGLAGGIGGALVGILLAQNPVVTVGLFRPDCMRCLPDLRVR